MNSTATDLKRMNPQRQKLNADIEAFLARGGKVEEVKGYRPEELSHSEYHDRIARIDNKKKAARSRQWNQI